MRTLIVAGAGAAIAYYFDPVSGRQRRVRLQETFNEQVGGKVVARTYPEDATIVEVPGPTAAARKATTR